MKLNSIEFGDIPFRKLKNMTLHIGKRLTVIAGHNGIGKTTILGLLANSSGLTNANHKSLFDNMFQANFQELFHLDEKSDYAEEKGQKPTVKIAYSHNKNNLIKNCNVTRHINPKFEEKEICKIEISNKEDIEKIKERFSIPLKEENSYIKFTEYKKIIKNDKRLKIIPRTDKTTIASELATQDGKVQIPTIYLGMSRMTPIGEYEEENIQIENAILSDEDIQYITNTFKKVIPIDISSNKKVLSHSFKSSKKRSKIPELNHNSQSISLGQDSLSSIITALASFNKLKREYNNYEGGILLIDEIDAGFHPRIQVKLIELLKSESRKLNLQIIFTTHSLTIIKEIFNRKNNATNDIEDSVIYLMDTRSPYQLECPTYPKIKNDMLSTIYNPESIARIEIYVEDEEAKYFIEKIFRNIDLASRFGFNLTVSPIKASCSVLLNIAKSENYFRKCILILDNDNIPDLEKEIQKAESNFKQYRYENVITLPNGNMDKNKEQKKNDVEYSPEYIIYRYLNFKLCDENFIKHIQKLQMSYDLLYENLIETFPTKDIGNREDRKKWFKNNKKLIDQIGLFDFWEDENKEEIDIFLKKIDKCIKYINNQ